MATKEPSASQVAKQAGATSFDEQASQYARLRPGYPPAAIDAALPAGATTVLDLAAGTGKLTGALLDRGVEVFAVEPLPGMLAELSRLFPAAHAVGGTAENIPLADSSVDAVLVGQAFHWFDPDVALAEIARVLRPGGSLALLWNHDDESDPLVTEIYQALAVAGRPPGGATGRGQVDAEQHPEESEWRTAPFEGHEFLSDPDLTEIDWQRRQTGNELVGLLNTYSYVIRATDSARSDLATTVGRIARRYQAADGQLQIPVICEVWRSTCR